MLKDSPLYTILSGFSFCDTPGIGTFYDFFSRIWQDGRNTLSPNGRFPKMRLPKGKKTRHSTHYVQYLCPFAIGEDKLPEKLLELKRNVGNHYEDFDL